MTTVYSNILVHLDGGERCAGRIQTGCRIASMTGARLTGLFAETDPNVPGPIRTWPTPFFTERRDAAEAAFTAALAADGLEGEFFAVASGRPYAIHAEIARATRASDLAILSQRDPDHDAHLPEFFVGHAIADSGGAVLVMPYVGHYEIGKGRAIIAWDGEPASARAVRAAIPLIAAESGVVVLMIPHTGREPDPDPPEFADPVHWMKGLGLTVEREHVVASSATVADMILSRVADDIGGLLVVGINNPGGMKSALRKTKARHLLDQITVPTLFAS